MILCEFISDVCRAVKFKKGKIKEVYHVERVDTLNFLKKRKKQIKGILINPRELYYQVIDKKFSSVAKNIIDEQFPEIRNRRWQRFEDIKGRLHIVSIDGTDLEFITELVKSSEVQCEIIDLSIFNVANYVLQFYEKVKNGVVINVTDDITYSIYFKNRVPFWGNSFPTAEFPLVAKRQVNYILSLVSGVKSSFTIFLNFSSAKTEFLDILGDFDVMRIDPSENYKNLKKITNELPSLFTALVGLSMRF